MEKNAYLAEVKALRDENERLREELTAFRQDFDMRVDALRRAYSLTVRQARVMAAMSTGEVMSRDRLARLCSYLEDASPRTVDWQMKRVRKSVPPDVHITSVYGVGFVLEGRSLQAVRDAMRNH